MQHASKQSLNALAIRIKSAVHVMKVDAPSGTSEAKDLHEDSKPKVRPVSAIQKRRERQSSIKANIFEQIGTISGADLSSKQELQRLFR